MSVVTRPTNGGGARRRSRQEAARFRKAQAGCRESLNALMAEHDGLAQAAVRRQGLACTLSFDELLQVARIGLWRAILGYDPARGWTFATYAWPCIVRPIWDAVKSHPPPVPAPLNQEADRWSPTTTEAQGADPEEVWEARCVEQALHDLVARLPYRLYRVVRARYGLGLDGPAPAQYRQIGACLNVSGERARQLHVEALIWLRQPAHAQTLRSLLTLHTRADYQRTAALAQAWRRRRQAPNRRGRDPHDDRE